MKIIKLFVFLLCINVINADIKSNAATEEEITQLQRSETFPKESLSGASDAYLEGYLQSLVDMHYYEYKVIVLVNDHQVWLANLPKNQMIANSMVSFVKDVPNVDDVKVINGLPPKEMKKREKYVNRPKVNGIWFPQNTELFLPLIANPRQVIYSVGYRGGDRVVGKEAVPISLGDDFPIYRWLNVFPCKGDLQIGVEGGIWSVFNIKVKPPNINGGTELVNTDFYVGIPITFAVNKWSFRFRAYHMSSHLGDEYMINHPNVVRKNPSFEAIDFFPSYQANDVFRLYFGPGFILHSDRGYPMDNFYVEYGVEARFLGTKFYYHRLYGTFFAAAHIRNWQYLHWKFDETVVAGYEWSKLQGVGRKIRIFGEFHNGFSLEGQFSKEKTTYGSIRLAYGF